MSLGVTLCVFHWCFRLVTLLLAYLSASVRETFDVQNVVQQNFTIT